MAINPKVTAYVRREIEKNYDTPTATLYQASLKLDPSIKKRSHLSFFASYVLPARRAENAGKKSAKAAKKAKGPKHQAAHTHELAINRMPESAPVASPPVHVPARSANSPQAAAEDVLRRVLTEVARDAMRAESRAEFVDLLARIDRHARDVAGLLANDD